jgi:hypothetical protein
VSLAHKLRASTFAPGTQAEGKGRQFLTCKGFLNRTGGLRCSSELDKGGACDCSCYRCQDATAVATVARRWNTRLQLLPFPGSQSNQPELADIQDTPHVTLITQHAARRTQLAAGARADVQGHGRTASIHHGGSWGRKACGDTHLGWKKTPPG